MKIKKRVYIPLLLAAVVLIATIGLLADFHRYAPGTQTVPKSDGGILFTITTYDGHTETRPFVKCMGHTWLSVENKTGHAVRLMDQELGDGEMLTFSIWAVSGHRGVVFNLEADFIRQFGRYDGRQSLSACVNEAKLAVMEAYITAHDDWTLGCNCSRWALELWNEVVEPSCRLRTQTLLYTPERLQRSLREFDCVVTDMDFSSAGGIWLERNGVREELVLCP